MIFYLIFAWVSASFVVIFCVFWRHILRLRLLASYSASFGVIFCVCVFFWEIAFLRNLKWTLRPRLLASNSSLYTTQNIFNPKIFSPNHHGCIFLIGSQFTWMGTLRKNNQALCFFWVWVLRG